MLTVRTRAAAVCAGLTLLVSLPTTPSASASRGGTTTICSNGVCYVVVTSPGGSGTGANGAAGGAGRCSWQGHWIPCSLPGAGTLNPSDGCYYKVADPLPPVGIGVDWGGHTPGAPGGAVYAVFCPYTNGLGPTGAFVWLAQPPPGIGPTAAQLAQQALSSLVIPKPTEGRYPSGRLRDGRAYTVVRAYTWYWTDPSTYKAKSARASAGPVWAAVTVTPVALTFTPGDGSAGVSCAGPGTPWRSGDGVWAPSPSGCEFRYQHSSIHQPGEVVTATYGIRWQVTWVGSGGTSGTLPDQTTTSTSTFAVAEVESVVTG